MTNHNYEHVEELLLRLLGSLSEVFADSEKAEVQDFVDAGEYGLALETLIDIVVEEDKRLRSDCLKLVHELSESMQLDTKALDEKLRKYVTDS